MSAFIPVVAILSVPTLIGIPLIGYHVYDWFNRQPEPDHGCICDVDPAGDFEIGVFHSAYFSADMPLNTTQLIGAAL